MHVVKSRFPELIFHTYYIIEFNLSNRPVQFWDVEWIVGISDKRKFPVIRDFHKFTATRSTLLYDKELFAKLDVGRNSEEI